MSITTIPVLLGLSRDQRTQRWRVTCPKCEHQFEPLTTRLAVQDLTCPKPKCRAEMVAYYNDEPPQVKLINRGDQQ